MKKDPEYLEKLKREWHEKIKAFDRVLEKIDNTHLSSLSNNDLSKLYEDFYRSYVDEFRYFMVLGDALSMHADRYLVPEFQKVLGADFTSVFPKLIATGYLSFIEEESMGREELIGMQRKKGSIPGEKLELHAKRFFYIQNNYAKAIRLTPDDFLDLIKKDIGKGVGHAEDIRDKQLKEKQELIKVYNLSGWHKTLLYIMDEFFRIQDTRKKYVLISNCYQFEFLKDAERRTGIPFRLLKYSIYPEFIRILEGNLDQKVFERRYELCACIHTQEGFEIAEGEDAQEALDFFQKDVSEQKEIKGMVASLGKARGRVKRLLKIHDMANIEEGDIIVASMTRPEMVPAMKKAAAIVTDEGGVTSHAAIVSRELGVPCIIGTKNATKILKDGDLVEVDAEKGIVRKI
ncbi:hypothetical protein JW968_05875 [Candidatus Woesearchaeota archaeon]|nr:hypothetical protein [Candidatus Woesearchaeota archaeon]